MITVFIYYDIYMMLIDKPTENNNHGIITAMIVFLAGFFCIIFLFTFKAYK